MVATAMPLATRAHCLLLIAAATDWGTNFPSSYLWLQANHFHDENATTLFASVAVVRVALGWSWQRVTG